MSVEVGICYVCKPKQMLRDCEKTLKYFKLRRLIYDKFCRKTKVFNNRSKPSLNYSLIENILTNLKKKPPNEKSNEKRNG